MEQYFAKQSANCCKLNFSNNLALTHKYILSPKKTIPNTPTPINKSAKKSLKGIVSHQALTNSKDSKKYTQFQSGKVQDKEQEEQLNDYGQVVTKKGRTETNRFQVRKQIKNSAQDPRIKQVKSLERKQVIHSPYKANLIEDIRGYRFHERANFVQGERQQQPRGSVFVKASINPIQRYREKPVFTETVPFYYRQLQNPYIQQSTIYQPMQQFNKISTYNQSPTKYDPIKQYSSNSYLDQTRNTLTKPPVLNKQNSTNYSQNFLKLYGEMQMKDEIKHDLKVSLELNNRNNYHPDNAVSILTKCPPSEESTILPPESKIRRKFQYQIDSFANQGNKNLDRRVSKEKYLKDEFMLAPKPSQSLRLNRRYKFKSIVSVESEHSSSSGDVNSVIIDQHPQHMLSSHPIKSLL